MLPVIARHVASALSIGEQQSVTCVREFQFGGVIPDLLFGIGCSEVKHSAAQFSKIPAGIVESFVFHAVQSGVGSSVDLIGTEIGISAQRLEIALKKLIRAGLVDRAYSDVAVRTEAAEMMLGVEIVAVEAKLFRWREALAQAISYQEFADRAYVAMDALRFQLTSDIADEFRQYGIGLLLCDRDTVHHAIVAKARARQSPHRARVAFKLAASFSGKLVGRSL